MQNDNVFPYLTCTTPAIDFSDFFRKIIRIENVSLDHECSSLGNSQEWSPFRCILSYPCIIAARKSVVAYDTDEVFPPLRFP